MELRSSRGNVNVTTLSLQMRYELRYDLKKTGKDKRPT